MKPLMARKFGALIAGLLALIVIGATARLVAPVLSDQAPIPTSGITERPLPSDLSKFDLAQRLVGAPTSTSQAPASPLAPAAGISGRVTNNGVLAAGITLSLLQSKTGTPATTIATTVTDSNGDYVFSNVPTLPAGYQYCVFFNNTEVQNPNYVYYWIGPFIAAYTAGGSVSGGVFDIADVTLQAPLHGAALQFPITFRWSTRAVPSDNYWVHLGKQSDESVYWNSASVGHADHAEVTSLPAGLTYNEKYWWWPVVSISGNGFGIPLYMREITFLSGTSGPKLVFLPLVQKMPTPIQSCDPYEPNNNRATAWGSLISGQAYQARLCQGDDDDWYYLNAQPSQPLVVTVRLPSALVNRTFFWIYHEDNTQPIAGCGRGPITNTNETINCSISQPGRYVIRLYTADSNVHYDNTQYYTLSAIFTPQGSASPTPTATSTRTATPTKTATPTLTPNLGLYGRVTKGGAAAAGVALKLRRYNSTTDDQVATTTTNADGRYVFTGVPSLPSGMAYYVKYGPNSTDPSAVSIWYGPDVMAYTAGTHVAAGDFDIADITLLSPAPGATVTLPATFTWQRRGLSGDTYGVVFANSDGTVAWRTGDLGDVGSTSITGLAPGMSYGKAYYWFVRVHHGVSSFGDSYYWRPVTFQPSAGAVTDPGLGVHLDSSAAPTDAARRKLQGLGR